MSDDTLDISFGDIEVDFGKAKELPRPKEDTYEFVIDDITFKASKDDPRFEKGVNCAVVLKFADPESVRTELEEEGDFSNFKVFDNIYIYFENPFGAKPFFEAVTGRELDENFKLGGPSDYIGERVGAFLTKQPHWQDPKKFQFKISPGSYYAV